MISGGIFGPKLCGKTTLAKEISKEYWRCKAVRTLVLDPHRDSWGEQALMLSDEDRFWDVVWNCKGALVIVEEAAATIQRDRNLMRVFTMMRHNRHRLLVIGHSGADLLPGMRNNLDTLFLFRQPASALDWWIDAFCEEKISDAAHLQQYEFLEVHSFKTPIKRRLLI